MSEHRRAPGLCSQALRRAWEWRLEAALLLSCAAALRLSAAVGPGGPVLAVGAAALLLWRAGAARRGLSRGLADAAQRRRFLRGLRSCGAGSPLGSVAAGPIEVSPAGFRVVVRVGPGDHVGMLEDSARPLAAALRAREVRVAPVGSDASLATLHVIHHDPLCSASSPWPLADAVRTSLWEPVPIGVDEEAQTVCVSLPEHNLLIGGEPGGGKSATLSLFVAAAALDESVVLSLFDAKQVELAPWAASAKDFCGPKVGDAVRVLEEIRAGMDRRYELLLTLGRRKVAPGDGIGLHVVALDELAFFLRGGSREERADFAEGLRDLVARGRAAGVVVVAATQKPSHDVVPTAVRDLFSYRLAHRCTTPEASDTILGQGWASREYSAATIDASARGVGYLLAEGALPRKMKSYYLDDAAVEDIARRAAALRGLP